MSDCTAKHETFDKYEISKFAVFITLINPKFQKITNITGSLKYSNDSVMFLINYMRNFIQRLDYNKKYPKSKGNPKYLSVYIIVLLSFFTKYFRQSCRSGNHFRRDMRCHRDGFIWNINGYLTNFPY